MVTEIIHEEMRATGASHQAVETRYARACPVPFIVRVGRGGKVRDFCAYFALSLGLRVRERRVGPQFLNGMSGTAYQAFWPRGQLVSSLLALSANTHFCSVTACVANLLSLVRIESDISSSDTSRTRRRT